VANFNKQQTALAIVQDTCGLLGLPKPAAVASNPTDVTAQQMWSLLRHAGRRLCKPTDGYRWQVLTRLWSLDTLPATTLYTLPDDWDSFIDTTAWNYTSRMPMLGPASTQQWQTLKARNLGNSVFSVVYRTSAGKLELQAAPATAQQLRLAYTSRAWVQKGGDPTTLRDYPDADDDLVLFDPELMVASLKLAFLTAKGFDTTAATADYKLALEAAINADSDAPVLSLVPGGGPALLDPQFNAPDTGYGS
jgi:hypothetical protein